MKEETLTELWTRTAARIETEVIECKADRTGDAADRLRDDVLSLEVRSGWQAPGEPLKAEEYYLLLGTGGPAVRIVGSLSSRGELETARLEVQDWGTPWTECEPTPDSVLEWAHIVIGEIS